MAKVTPKLVLSIDDTERALKPERLSEPGYFDGLRARCERAKQPVVFNLNDLLELDDAQRFVILGFITDLDRYRLVVGRKSYDDLLTAVLELTPETADVAKARSYKMAALEAAVLLYPDALDVACGQIAERMRRLKVRGVRTAGLIRDAQKIQAGLANGSARSIEDGPMTVRAVLPDAPVAEEVKVPPGWGLSAEGVVRLGTDHPGPLIAAPLLIRERGLEVGRGEELLTLAWLRDGDWQTKTVERAVVADARSITTLAAYGAPVTSLNARQVVQYMADYETQNLGRLPARRVSRQLGWQGPEGKDGFLVGSLLVTAQGIAETGREPENADSPSPPIQFRGADEGDEQTARGFHREGTLEGWLEAIAPVARYHRVRLALYASFAAVMLMILRARNIILDFAGENTSGKTTALRVAGSVWGDPHENRAQGDTVVHTWDATAVWRERAPATLNNLPFILDDSKRARRREDVEQTIYDFSQGRGRGRGSVKGLASQSTFQTVLLTSGEQPATSFTEAGGTRARVLTLWGSPFGAKDQATGDLARVLNRRIKRHYGHAGPLFVRFLLRNRTEWGSWREEFRTLVREYEKKAGDNPLAGRLAEDFAAIHLTAMIAHKAMRLPWKFADPIRPLWTELVQEAGEADRAAAALRHVMGWATAHQAEFYQPHGREVGEPQPFGGWAGVWPSDTAPKVIPGSEGKLKGWKFIGFLPHRLVEVLREGGFELEPVLRTWRDRGWLKQSEEKTGVTRSRVKVRIGSRSDWVVAVTRSAVEEAEGG